MGNPRGRVWLIVFGGYPVCVKPEVSQPDEFGTGVIHEPARVEFDTNEVERWFLEEPIGLDRKPSSRQRPLPPLKCEFIGWEGEQIMTPDNPSYPLGA